MLQFAFLNMICSVLNLTHEKFIVSTYIVVLLLTACHLQISEEDLSLRVNTDLLNSYLGEPLDVEFTYNR